MALSEHNARTRRWVGSRFSLGIAIAGTCTHLSLASAAEFISVPVDVSPHPTSANLIIVNGGHNLGLRPGDRGAISLPGLTVSEDFNFGPTHLPLTVLTVSANETVAQIPAELPILRPASAWVETRSIPPQDLRPLSPHQQQTVSDGIATPPPSTPSLSPSAFTARSQTWSPTTTALCGANIPTGYARNVPDQLCVQVTREDRLAHAILTGQSPHQVTARDAARVATASASDRRLQDVIRLYFLQPTSPRSLIAIGQEYLRFHHYPQAANWLAQIRVPDTEPSLQAALIHSRMYAAYHSQRYQQAIELSQQLPTSTTQQTNLVAAAHYQLGQHEQARQLLEPLPPLDEVANNRAITLYTLALSAGEPNQRCPAHRPRPTSDSPNPEAVEASIACQTNDVDREIQVQRPARTLLESATTHPVALANLAILDVRHWDFASAFDRLQTAHQQVATHYDGDRQTVALQRNALQYITNFQASEAFFEDLQYRLAQDSQPSGVRQAANIITGQIAGAGVIPAALFGLVAIASEQARNEAQARIVLTELQAIYNTQLQFIPIVSPPDAIGISPYS